MKEFFKEWAWLLIAEAGLVLIGLWVLARYWVPVAALIVLVALGCRP